MNPAAVLEALNPVAGLRVLSLPFRQETTDVLIGSYLSREAALEDYRAALACGAYLHAAIVSGRDLTGTGSVEQTDHIALEGAQGLGTLGLLLGLTNLPAVPLTAGLGAAAGGALGEAAHLFLVSKVHQRATTIPLGCAVLILAYPRSSAARVQPSVTRAVNKVISEATGHHVQALHNAIVGAQHDMAGMTATGPADPRHAEATATAPHPATPAGRARRGHPVPAPRPPAGRTDAGRAKATPAASSPPRQPHR
ncbi:MAG: hypothetical protein ACXVFZ_00975 [Blastococcus sp.]